MLRSAASKAMWIGRMTSTVVGLALILALVLGLASMAVSATGQPFILGKHNTADQVTKLIRHGAGAALSLEVQDCQPPMKVDSSGKVANLNSDLLDGKSDTDFYAAGSKVDDSSHADTAANADTADTLVNKDSTDFAAAYKSTVVVSPVGTDTENGTALLDAFSGITDASAANPYLLSIEPGTYDLGNGSLQMEGHVDIEGSGELSTTINSNVISAYESPGDDFTGTVQGANNAELRFLTVSNTGTLGECHVAISNISASPRLTYMTASASGWGDAVGVLDYGSSPIIKQSTLIGSTHSLIQGDCGTVKVADTQLVGPVTNLSATGFLQCIGNYDENLAAVTCP